MTLQEAKLILMTTTDPRNDPAVWEAYEIVYGRKHPYDPDLDEASKQAEAERRFKSTPQHFNAADWPKAEHDQDVFGTNKLGDEVTPYTINPKFFATEETAFFLGEILGADPEFVEGPTDGPFWWPGWWTLVWPSGDQRNAGIVGDFYNRKIREFQAHIERWNRNLGALNPVTDPQTRTPDVLTLERLSLDTNVDPAPEPEPEEDNSRKLPTPSWYDSADDS